MKRTAIFFMLSFVLVALLASLAPASVAHAATVLYAKPNATGTGDCLSWANGCTLQTALTNAGSGDEIGAANSDPGWSHESVGK